MAAFPDGSHGSRLQPPGHVAPHDAPAIPEATRDRCAVAAAERRGAPRSEVRRPAPAQAASARTPSYDATALPDRGAMPPDDHDALLLRVRQLHKSYYKARLEIPVLRGVDLDVRDGELLAIVGQSGSGKSTLLHMLGTLDAPDQGEIYFAGQRIDRLPARRRDAFRNHCVGMIFQFYHLLPELSTLENVLSPLMIRHGWLRFAWHRRRHVAAARRLLEMVGLGHRLKHRPRELSGGEMQRAAIARALVNEPRLLLADEPTGNLDSRTGGEILRLLRQLNQQQRLTIVMVTHDAALAAQADRVVTLVDGRIAA